MYLNSKFSFIYFGQLYLRLTCVPEFFVPVHGQDDEDVAQDVHHDGEDQHAGQRSGHSRRLARPAAARVPGQTVGTVHMLELQIHLPSRCSAHTWGGGAGWGASDRVVSKTKGYLHGGASIQNRFTGGGMWNF